ncbi:hypothetical protein [Acetobacter orientalis]|uniref:Uncharacterized protein n=1 Tax=Acetobacter orientalis TaxID=146474 RepID=A0A251ZWH5_9PROT|nr:hypothetical protein [Acetobacter orientalis]OUI79009.1 hypothetical protein HK12_01405 [Acetobacter orientalis]
MIRKNIQYGWITQEEGWFGKSNHEGTSAPHVYGWLTQNEVRQRKGVEAPHIHGWVMKNKNLITGGNNDS